MNIAFGVCVGSWRRLWTNVVPYVNGYPLHAVSGQTSIAVAYNAMLDLASGADALILLHDDLELTDPQALEKITAALAQPGVGIVGVAGGGAGAGIGWWGQAPIGHQKTDVMNIDFGIRAGQVDVLEGSLLALNSRAIDNVRFDENYPGFHGYDADICMQAIDLDLSVQVIDVDTWHHTQMGYKSESSRSDWQRADQYFRDKWGLG